MNVRLKGVGFMIGDKTSSKYLRKGRGLVIHGIDDDTKKPTVQVIPWDAEIKISQSHYFPVKE